MAKLFASVAHYRNQALLRWLPLAAIVWLSDARSPAFILSLFFVVVIVDAVAAGVGNIAFSDTLAKTIPNPLLSTPHDVESPAGYFSGAT